MKFNKRTHLLYESILVVLIITTPFLLYLYILVPENLKEFDTIFGTINSTYFETIQMAVYWFFNKFVPLFLFILLYITHNKWWSHAIIIPISLYLFQLISVINDSTAYLDEIEFIYTIPIIILVLVPLYLLRSKMSIYIAATNLKKEMDDKMKNLNKS